MLGALYAIGCWALGAGLALISVLLLATGAYRRESASERSLVFVCAGLGVMAGLFFWVYNVANLGPGELAIFRDRAVLVEHPRMIVAVQPPASINLTEELEITIPVTVIDRSRVALALTNEDRAKVFVTGDIDSRNEEAKKVLSDALGREVVCSAQGSSVKGVSLEDALRLHGLAVTCSPSVGGLG